MKIYLIEAIFQNKFEDREKQETLVKAVTTKGKFVEVYKNLKIEAVPDYGYIKCYGIDTGNTFGVIPVIKELDGDKIVYDYENEF